MLGRFFLDCNRGFSPLKVKKLTQEYGVKSDGVEYSV